MKHLLSAMTLWLIELTHVQGQPCHCPGSGYGSRVKLVFSMRSGQTINLCGWPARGTKGAKDTVYQGFELFLCGQKPFLTEDETTQSQITQLGDTLRVGDYVSLPTGLDFALVSRTFYTEQFFFRGQKLIDTSYFRKDLPRYSAAQIHTVLHQYATLTGDNADSVNLVAHRLFWAYVSGSSSAGQCLKHIKQKFKIYDGAVAEEFDNTWALYQLWKHTTPGTRF
jgi:hypothetical protein